MMYGK